MPELPALPLGPPLLRPRDTGSAHRPTLRGPGRDRQAERLDDSFDRLTSAFRGGRVAATDEPAAHESELVLVLEVAGDLSEFVNAMRKISGLEFLAEELEDQVSPDEFAAIDSHGRPRRYTRDVFLVASDATAWERMLSLWSRFKRGESFDRGYAPFRQLFERLKALRRWDDRDRLELSGAAEAWERELANAPDDLVNFEVELWWRESSERRADALATLRTDLEAAGGELVAEYSLAEIAYSGALARARGALLLDAAHRREVRWLRTEGIRLFHPMGQIAAPAADEVVQASPVPAPALVLARTSSRLALLDGLPVEGHELLAGRLLIDDPDSWAATTPVNTRVHGSAMASLVIHGDLSDSHVALTEPIYLRPLLQPNAPSWVTNAPEELPRSSLPIHLIHSAVARLFEGERVAPETRVVVVAIADSSQPCNRFVSPLARLLDWLSFRYNVLFLVAGGNHLQDIELQADFDEHADPRLIESAFLQSVLRTAGFRRPLSPAEAVNAITVGASHNDASGAVPQDGLIDPLVSPQLASVLGPIGPGLRRSMKPELLFPGGRQLVRLRPLEKGQRIASLVRTSRPPGLRVARPGIGATALRATSHVCGTSGAAALAGHAIVELLGAIDELKSAFGDRFPEDRLDVVLAKAALAHGCSWGSGRQAVEAAMNVLGIGGSRDRVARMLGYGLGRLDGSIECEPEKVTVFAVGRIGDGQLHSYSFPLPRSLASSIAPRRVTLTLAWLSPINPFHRGYRRAALKLEPAGEAIASKFVAGVETTEPASRRGTLEHEILEGQRAVPYAPDTAIELAVSCRADAGALEDDVPYAVLATLEVPSSFGIQVYEEVREQLRIPLRTAVPAQL
jgi:hypothetical protein